MSYKKVLEVAERIYHLRRIGSLMGWDEAALMPAGAVRERALAAAELSMTISEKLSEPRLQDWIKAAEQENLSAEQRRNLELFKKDRLHRICLPSDFVKKQKLALIESEFKWRKLRPENNWNDFRPLLEKVISLTREEARYRSEEFDLAPYDAQLNFFFDGVRSKDLNPLFDEVKQFVIRAIPKALQQRQALPGPLPFVSQAKQTQLSRQLMTDFGFDWQRGRLDVSTHPFSTTPPGESRITTRFDENNFLISLMGTIHETGHALYEQNLAYPPLSPIEQSSFVLHEGQSLFYEMQIAGHSGFAEYLVPLIKKFFDLEISKEELAARLKFVEPSLIRVDADELTYPLHVILRYEIESALLAGDLEAADLPSAWNEKMQKYLGLSTEGDYKNGCMQDIHWNIGSFGYFPAYLLGAMAASQTFQKQAHDRPEMIEEIRRGQFSNIKNWMTKNLWQLGRQFDFQDLLRTSTGQQLNTQSYLSYLENKYCGSH